MNFALRMALAAILLAASVPVAADEAADAFSNLYGEDLKRVAATPSPADDVALAKQLLEAAGKVANQPALSALLCEKACELALKDPTGYPTAKAAMEFLAAGAPGKKAEALQKFAAMYQRAYNTARAEAKARAGEALIESLKVLAEAQAAGADIDGTGATLKQALAVATAIKSESKASVQAQLAGLASRQQVEKQIAPLKAKLAADPKDAASRKEIVRLYLVELDSPAQAAKFVDETCDEATRKYVPAAAKPVEDAPEAACTQLGDWYKGLADQATAPASTGAMLDRAKAYYTRFMGLHKAEDVARAGATLALKKIEDALAKSGPAPEPKSNPPTVTFDLGKGVAMKLVLIAPGKFMMGSPDSEQDRMKNEGPQHEVTISKPFYMGMIEVTQAQYEAIMGKNPSAFRGPANPVEKVSWDDAAAFCLKLSAKAGKTFRLPTEAEWEYACRAGTKTRFSFGDSDSALGDYAWWSANSGARPHPVGQKKPNPWGLYDMYGNVNEWCADWYGSYSDKASTDPQGPRSGSTCVIRGGSFVFKTADQGRSAHRPSEDPASHFTNVGFRCVMAP